MKAIELIGIKFGRWTVLSRRGSVFRNSAWACRCECGAEKVVSSLNLRNGTSKSCGCLRSEVMRERMQGQPFHAATKMSWRKMIERCENEKDIGYQRYGGRGISVCSRWHSFENFASDMGDRPVGTSIDRINPEGNYEPGNCRWSNRIEQSANRRTTVWVELDGELLSLKHAARKLGVNYDALRYRMRLGMDLKDAVKNIGISNNG